MNGRRPSTTPPAPAQARTGDSDRAATVVVTIQAGTEDFFIDLPADANIFCLKSAISTSKGCSPVFQNLFKDSEKPLADFVQLTSLFEDGEELKLFLVVQISDGDAHLCV
jgi:hypothetical protein